MLSNIHPKYIIEVKQKNERRFNPTHEVVAGSIATVIDLTVGERGWIAYRGDSIYDCCWHRLHTSPIQDVNMDEDGNITVETLNTFYILKKID
jgi:hypothetical protein